MLTNLKDEAAVDSATNFLSLRKRSDLCFAPEGSSVDPV
jgi:hypothetical protein